jgi:sodium transport system permease protein
VNPIRQVFNKEFREIMRDKRTRSVAFFGPVFVMILVICGLGSVIGSVAEKKGQTIHYVRSQNPLLAYLALQQFKLVEVPDVATGKKLIQEDKAKLVLDFGPAPADGGQQTVYAYFDPKNQKGQIALSIVSKHFDQQSGERLKAFLVEKHLPESAGQPIKVVEREVKIGEQGAGQFIVGMLPYLIVIWAFYGGFSMATDMVAGEKEKATLETLLITPVTRTQIVLGKFLALAAICLISSLSSVVGLLLVSILKLPGSAFMLKDGLGITPTTAAVIVAVLLPTVALFAALLLSFSTYAKNAREAQSYISMASFVVVIPAAFSQLIGLTDAASQGWVNFIPVLNAANNIRNALLGKPDWVGTGITFLVSGAIAAALISVVVKLFNREQVLTRV